MGEKDYKTLSYEAKCRICGNITEWYFSTTEFFTWQEFAAAMQDHISYPRQCKCAKCQKQTVQDVVSYTPAL